MYIAPNSTIKLLHNVPIDSTYEHTIYFSPDGAGNTAQYNYFAGKTKYTFSGQSYQRVKRGYIRIGMVADNLYDCNYLMFQNTNFGSKWFYAFIKSIEYINNSVSEIEFEIDVMQTWNSEYQLKQCYVVREHRQQGDKKPLYTKEPLEPGTLIYNKKDSFDMNEMNLVIMFTPGNASSGHIYFNTYTKVGTSSVMPVTPGNISDIDNVIDQLTTNNQEIIAMYQYPKIFESGSEGVTIPRRISVDRLVTLDGYTPKNTKLLYYPFSFMRVSALNGKYQDYIYEYFVDNVMIQGYIFEIKCITLPEVNVVVYPIQYKSLSECYEEKMVISDFPVCAWSTDSFEKWWADNKWSIAANGISKAISLTASLSMGSSSSMAAQNKETSTIAEATEYVAETTGNIMQAIDAPNNVSGNTTSGNVNAGIGQQCINFYHMTMKKERAEAIDEYFERYGYTTNRNKIPNRNVRPHWCYTKTNACTISGSVPSDDMKKICSIYNNGITFWINGDEVGDYSLNNHFN